jgi:hypothetical protein
MIGWPFCIEPELSAMAGHFGSKWITFTNYHAKGKKAMNLTFEKPMQASEFTNLKRYVYGFMGVKGSPNGSLEVKFDHLEYKGNEARRRDISRMAQRVLNGVFDRLIRQIDPLGAFEYIQEQIDLAMSGKINIHELVITKSLKHDPEDFDPSNREQSLAKIRKRKAAEAQATTTTTATAPVSDVTPVLKKKGKRFGPPPPVGKGIERFFGGGTAAAATTSAAARLTQDIEADYQKLLQYGKAQIHANLALRMNKRPGAEAYHSCDRVPFVFVRRDRKAKGAERGEDPIYAIKNQMPIDMEKYLIDHLRTPLARILDPIDPRLVPLLFENVLRPVESRQAEITEFTVAAHKKPTTENDGDDDGSDVEMEDVDEEELERRRVAELDQAEDKMLAEKGDVYAKQSHYGPSMATLQWLHLETDVFLEALRKKIELLGQGRRRSLVTTGGGGGGGDSMSAWLRQAAVGHCLVCRTSVRRANEECKCNEDDCEACAIPALCLSCASEEGVRQSLIEEASQEAYRARQLNLQVWNNCERCCDGNMERALECTNRDCEKLLYRIQVQEAAKQAGRHLTRFRPFIQVEQDDE